MNIPILVECDVCGEFLEITNERIGSGAFIVAVPPCAQCVAQPPHLVIGGNRVADQQADHPATDA